MLIKHRTPAALGLVLADGQSVAMPADEDFPPGMFEPTLTAFDLA